MKIIEARVRNEEYFLSLNDQYPSPYHIFRVGEGYVIKIEIVDGGVEITFKKDGSLFYKRYVNMPYNINYKK